MSLASVIARSKRDREDWRYTDLEKLLGPLTPAKAAHKAANSQLPPLPSIVDDATQRHQIVFVNGVWKPDLSHLGELPKGVIDRGGTHDYRLTLEGETCLITAPIELVFLTSSEGAPLETATKLHITLGRSGRLTLIEHHVAADSDGATVAKMVDTEIKLGPQSKMVHAKIMHGRSDTAHLATATVDVAEGAYYRNFAFLQGRKLTRNEIAVNLGDQAQCALNGVMLLRGREHADTLTNITHAKPNGVSRQFYKSVLTDQAHGVFQGKIFVAKDAQKTDGRQLSRALLLSDQAEMDAKPELQIHADDVSCAHGTTVGELDGDALFYLRSRGLDVNEARALLLRAFIDEAINEMHEAEGRDYVRTQAGRWLNEQE